MEIHSERLYRVGSVADLLDISKSTVYRAVSSGDLTALRIGDSIRIPGGSLAAWLAQCGHAPAGAVK